MATLNGTDVQQNWFSAVLGGCGIGDGGKTPVSLPANSFPTDGIYDPANLTCQLAALAGANAKTAGAYDAILKMGNGLNGVTLTNVTVAQGFEDSFYANDHVSNVSVSGNFATSGAAGLRVITIKGGCTNIKIAGVIHQHGTSEGVKADDWADQSYDHSTNIDLTGLTAADGKPIVVVARYGCGLTLGSSCKRAVLSSIGLTTYWWFKRIVRLVPFINGATKPIPVGTSGPSWLP